MIVAHHGSEGKPWRWLQPLQPLVEFIFHHVAIPRCNRAAACQNVRCAKVNKKAFHNMKWGASCAALFTGWAAMWIASSWCGLADGKMVVAASSSRPFNAILTKWFTFLLPTFLLLFILAAGLYFWGEGYKCDWCNVGFSLPLMVWYTVSIFFSPPFSFRMYSSP